MRLNLPANPPFSLYAVTHSHGWAQLAPFNLTSDNEELSYILRLNANRTVDLKINQASNGVAIEINEQLIEQEKTEITQSVNWMLALNQDFSSFYELANQEPKLEHVQEKAQGRLLRSPTLFEDVIKTILTTNTAWGGTIRMTEALVSQYGDPLPGYSSKHAFPTPAAIAQTDERTIREKTHLGYRSPYILQLAREIEAGNQNLEALKTSNLNSDQLRKEFLAIKGVGNYAAANLLMLLGHYDYLTIDSWALKMVSHEWYNDTPIGNAEVEAAFEHWGEWKGLAYWLWNWSYKVE